MKKILLIIISVILIILIAVGIYMNPLLPIITGYAAKNLASGIFVSGRDQKDIEAVDLNFSFIQYTRNRVDLENKTVVSKFLWNKATAVYQDGYGCTLVRDFTKEEILDRPPLPYQSSIKQHPESYWPKGDKLPLISPKDVNYSILETAVNNAFALESPRMGSRAIIVVYKDQIVAEKYADGFSAETRFLSWSMAKSITNALVGILVKEEKIDIYNPIMMPGWDKDERAAITWSDMMHMGSGLEWEEDYGNESDVNVMLYKVGDFGSFTADKSYVAPPNTIYNYSSGSSNLVSLRMRDYFECDVAYYAFPYNKLFKEIDMNSVVFETDAAGIYVGSSYLYATARDFARFGLLYLNDGYWLGKQILPKEWVDYSSTPADASGGEYAAYFYANESLDLPDVPNDTYYCRGHDGQRIYIVPSRDLLVVRLGYSKKGTFDFNLMMKEILAAFPEK